MAKQRSELEPSFCTFPQTREQLAHSDLQRFTSIYPRMGGPKCGLLASRPARGQMNSYVLNFSKKKTASPPYLAGGNPCLLRLFPRSTHARYAYEPVNGDYENPLLEMKYTESHRGIPIHIYSSDMFNRIHAISTNSSELCD